MIVALLRTLSGTASTGRPLAKPARAAILPTLPPFAVPARAKDVGEEHAKEREAAGPLKEMLERLASRTLRLVAAHVGGVALASVRHQENLARAVLTGAGRAPGPGDAS